MKFCLAHLGMRPSLAILDPELTIELPANLTAWTGVDALTHALEAYLVPGLNPLCDGAALEALKLISKWLKVAFDDPKNIDARGGMLIGSCLAGVAFTKGLGLVHSISHMVGAEYNTQHGLTNAIILPAVMKFNLPHVGEKVRFISHAMDLKDASSEIIIQEIEEFSSSVANRLTNGSSLLPLSVTMSGLDTLNFLQNSPISFNLPGP